MDNKNKALILVITLVSMVILYWSVNALSKAEKAATSQVTEMSEGHNQEAFEKAKAAETDDPCQTPDGYTDESWREHMGHHPGMYEECL